MVMIVQEIAALVAGQVLGDGNLSIADVAALDKADARHLSFVESERQLPRLKRSRAGAVIAGRWAARMADSALCGALILVDDPQAAFVTAMLKLRPARQRPVFGVSPQAHVHPTALIGPETNIHPGACIGAGARIGARCDIHSGVAIGAGCQVGDDVIIYPNAVLYDDVSVGNRSIVHATAVLGADGFGYRFAQGRFVKIPHTGTVVVEDDVEIGAGTTIDRAMIGATVIGAGTKLDNQVMIAHNCELGKHNAFASQVGLAGSVTTGDYVRLAGQVGVADHSRIGTGATVGPQSGVYVEVPAGAHYIGFPAGPEKDQMRLHLNLSKVPEMRMQLRDLIAQVQELQARLDAERALPDPRQAVA